MRVTIALIAALLLNGCGVISAVMELQRAMSASQQADAALKAAEVRAAKAKADAVRAGALTITPVKPSAKPSAS